MAEGLEVFLIVGGLAVLVGLLARCPPRARGRPEAWHRHEARDALSQMFDCLMARAIYDPDCQWHWGACDRQLGTIRVMAMRSCVSRSRLPMPRPRAPGCPPMLLRNCRCYRPVAGSREP